MLAIYALKLLLASDASVPASNTADLPSADRTTGTQRQCEISVFSNTKCKNMRSSKNAFANTLKYSRKLNPKADRAWLRMRAAAREGSAGLRFSARSSGQDVVPDTQPYSDAQQKARQTHKMPTKRQSQPTGTRKRTTAHRSERHWASSQVLR